MQGLIVQSFIDELLTRIDIVEFIDSFVPLKKRGNSYTACCPFHHEKSPSFNVSATKQFYHCFGCSASGNVISFAMQYLQQTFPDAVATLAARAGLQVVYEKQGKAAPDISLYQLLDKVAKYYEQSLRVQGQLAIDYLKGRGLSGQIAKQFQLGYAQDDWHALVAKFPKHKADLVKTGMLITKDNGQTYDRYRQRLIFPIHNRTGKIIGFGGRALLPEQTPKYLNSPETVLFQKSRELYGLYQVIQQSNKHKRIIVVEGYMDVLALVQFGIANVVATLGTATTTYHVQQLAKFTAEIVFCFDGDKAGRQAARKALDGVLQNLDKDINASFVFLPEGQDPDSLVRSAGSEQFIQLLDSAQPLHDFVMQTLQESIDVSTVSGRTKLIKIAEPLVSLIPNCAYKQVLLQDLARVTHIDAHRIGQFLHGKAEEVSVDNSDDNQQRSPLRVLLAILLQNPQLYHQERAILETALTGPNMPKALVQVLNHLSADKNITTAAMVEKWRDTPIFSTINDLAGFEHKVPPKALLAEVLDIAKFLNKQGPENKIQQLIAKSRKVSLTESERKELQMLLKTRHNLTSEK